MRSSWMGDLGDQIASTLLKDLAIPGSHDSGSYNMTGAASAQGVDVYEQLRAGARYLDLRVIWNKNSADSSKPTGPKMTQLPIRDPDYYLYHGDFVSDNKWSSVLEQIERFLKENQREILIVSFLLYPRQDQIERTARLSVWQPLLDRFGPQLVTRSFVETQLKLDQPGRVKLRDLWDNKRRMVIFSGDANLDPEQIWPNSKMRSFSADTGNFLEPTILLRRLDENVGQPRGNDLWYLGTQFTPHPAHVVATVGGAVSVTGGGLLRDLASISTPLILQRLETEWRDMPLNIVGGDWIHLFEFCKTVIDRNLRPRQRTTVIAHAASAKERTTIAALSWGSNRVDIFAIGAPDKQMYHKAWTGSALVPLPQSPTSPRFLRWADWEPLGGKFSSPPSVVSWGPNRADIFGLGAYDNQMYHKAWTGSALVPSPTDWEPLGGVFSSPPTVVSWGPNRLDIFCIGTDKQMYHKARTDNAWVPPAATDWEPLGGQFNGPPAVVSWGPNRLDIFGIGTDNQMYHKARTNNAWVPPAATDWEPLGGVFNSPPAVVSWGPNRLDIFGIGADNQMYHKARTDNAWVPPAATDWEPLGGVFNSPPAVVSEGPNRLDIFCIGADNQMYHKARTDNAWVPIEATDWESLGGVLAISYQGS